MKIAIIVFLLLDGIALLALAHWMNEHSVGGLHMKLPQPVWSKRPVKEREISKERMVGGMRVLAGLLILAAVLLNLI